MQAIPLARASLLRPILDYLEQTGVELGPRLHGAHALLHDPTALLPLTMGGALLEEAERCSGRPDIGIRAGAAASILDYSGWGPLIGRAATVGDLVSLLIRSAPRMNSGNRFWSVRRGKEVWLHQRFSSRLTQGRRVASEFALTLILQGLRLATGPSWRPLEIHLEGAPPPHAAELAALASRRICFEQPCMALAFPERTLECRYPPRPIAPQRAERIRTPASSFEDSIRSVIEALVRVGSAELGTAAEATHMSERSLQRRLAECGLSFTRLVEQVRFESARRMLRDPSLKIVQVSAELGYTDSANFTRAFRRWAGVSPQVYRRSA